MMRQQTRRFVVWSGAVVAAPWLIPAVLAKPAENTAEDSLAGQLLVATPEMSDRRFRRTVILMAEHNKKGAFGVAINRLYREMPIAQLLQSLGQDSRGANGIVRIFAGGPVQPQKGFIVHSPEYRRARTATIDSHLAMTSDPVVLRDIGRGQGPRQSIVIFGYSGWGPGQLEAELAAGGWFTIPEEPKLVFDVDRDAVWDEAMRRRTISL